MAKFRDIATGMLLGAVALLVFQGWPDEASTAQTEFFRSVTSIHFAMGCGILSTENEALPLIAKEFKHFDPMKSDGDVGRYMDSFAAAKQRGLDLALKFDKCNWWDQHPQITNAIRQSAILAAE